VDQEIVTAGGVVDLPLVDAVDHHLPGEPVPFYDLNGLLVYSIGHEVFSQSHVVRVGDLLLDLRWDLVFELRNRLIVEVLRVDEVDVSHVHLAISSTDPVETLFSKESSSYLQVMFIVILLFFIFDPWVVEDLCHTDPALRLKDQHLTYKVFHISSHSLEREVKVTL
jgi:hypothetical protein